MRTKSGEITILLLLIIFSAAGVRAGGGEYTGQFDPTLVANTEDFEKIILKFATPEQAKGRVPFTGSAHFAAGLLINPQTQDRTVLTVLAEEDGKAPIIFFDSNGDGRLADDEKFALKQSKPDNPYLWETTVEIKLKDSPFKAFPLFLRYFRSISIDKMGPEDRLITQSTEALARGRVDINGKKIIVQYAYLVDSGKVDPQNGWLGVDADGNGEVDMDNLSPEAAKANNETVVFRVGETYISTKKADVSKNQIVVKENSSKDFKRLELYLGKEFPDFSFTDFDSKKRKFSEYRGKYVLLDIWGFWCPACRTELPYLREAHRRFQNRNLVLVGLNTDEDFTIGSMKEGLNKAGMNWTHAQFTSVVSFLRDGLRINSFPTTFLISPDGKILSMSRAERDEPDLRGKDLLETLDEILPKP